MKKVVVAFEPIEGSETNGHDLIIILTLTSGVVLEFDAPEAGEITLSEYEKFWKDEKHVIEFDDSNGYCGIRRTENVVIFVTSHGCSETSFTLPVNLCTEVFSKILTERAKLD